MAELVLPDPCVVLLVGPAGSGKSTFAARHFPPAAILSSDALREAISGDAADQRVSKAAFAALHRALERRLAAGRLAVIDATNLTAAARAAIRRIAARSNLPVVAIVLDVPEAVVRARNAARVGRVVPDEVVRRHLDALRAALGPRGLPSEGYLAIVRLTNPAEIDRLTVRLEPAPPRR